MKDLVPAATPEELEPVGRLLEEQFGLRLTLGNRDLIDGGLRLLTMFLDEFFETLDANTIVPGKTDYSYDIIR